MNQKVSTMFASLKKIEHFLYRMTIRRLEFGDDEQTLKEVMRRDLSARTQDVGFFEE